MRFLMRLVVPAVVVGGGQSVIAATAEQTLTLHLRSRAKVAGAEQERVREETAEWAAAKTALIICDMWDDHWCKGAAARVAELAGPMNRMVHAARDKGVFIIHSPSSVTGFPLTKPPGRRGQSLFCSADCAKEGQSPAAL